MALNLKGMMMEVYKLFFTDKAKYFDELQCMSTVSSGTTFTPKRPYVTNVTPAYLCVNTSSHIGWTTLHEACRMGDLDSCKTLISHNVNIFRKDVNGYDALCIAALHGHSKLVEYLISEGAPSITMRRHSPTDMSSRNDLLNSSNPPRVSRRLDPQVYLSNQLLRNDRGRYKDAAFDKAAVCPLWCAVMGGNIDCVLNIYRSIVRITEGKYLHTLTEVAIWSIYDGDRSNFVKLAVERMKYACFILACKRGLVGAVKMITTHDKWFINKFANTSWSQDISYPLLESIKRSRTSTDDHAAIASHLLENESHVLVVPSISRGKDRSVIRALIARDDDTMFGGAVRCMLSYHDNCPVCFSHRTSRCILMHIVDLISKYQASADHYEVALVAARRMNSGKLTTLVNRAFEHMNRVVKDHTMRSELTHITTVWGIVNNINICVRCKTIPLSKIAYNSLRFDAIECRIDTFLNQ